ncbi:MAG TPA: xanthine dehydrogenase accessory protein XdhC [Casimicrobiaceae bacterium]|nr:xanthine dehydrogenase accessory protein XdhC [Casimicrobiaceae bacterium]
MIANRRWPDALRDALLRRERSVLVAVALASGSTPREAGAAMVVTPTGLAGTIGGGHLEFEAVRLAREALATRATGAWAVRFPLAARLGQCCGGVATLVFAVVDDAGASWLDVVDGCQRAALACGVVTRLAADGAGRLVVTLDDARGTLGDAALDSAAIVEARRRLGDERAGTGLAEAGGQALFVHVVRPFAFHVRVFGNGHVGRALVQVLGALPADVAWVDTREHDFPDGVPGNVQVVATDDPTAEVACAPRGAYLVVMTHSHALDFDIVEAALGRDDWRYVGLIGSKAKRAQFGRRLAQRGWPADALARVTCPIGATLAGKEPGVIAVGIAAELLALREQAAREAGAGAGLGATVPIGARMRALLPRPDTDPAS